MTSEERNQIERAFCTRMGGSTCECNCGKLYFDDGDNGWDWEDGELERLRADKATVALPYGVETIHIQGRIYVKDCGCWVDMAERLLIFLRDHQKEIGLWYRLEKKRLERAAEDVPVIDLDVPRNTRLILS